MTRPAPVYSYTHAYDDSDSVLELSSSGAAPQLPAARGAPGPAHTPWPAVAGIAVAGLVILAGFGWFIRRQRIRSS